MQPAVCVGKSQSHSQPATELKIYINPAPSIIFLLFYTYSNTHTDTRPLFVSNLMAFSCTIAFRAASRVRCTVCERWRLAAGSVVLVWVCDRSCARGSFRWDFSLPGFRFRTFFPHLLSSTRPPAREMKCGRDASSRCYSWCSFPHRICCIGGHSRASAGEMPSRVALGGASCFIAVLVR